MRLIRKIWIGKSIHGDSMSWELKQKVKLGRKSDPNCPTGVVHHIEFDEESDEYVIYVKKDADGVIGPWKSTKMETTIEYDLDY